MVAGRRYRWPALLRQRSRTRGDFANSAWVPFGCFYLGNTSVEFGHAGIQQRSRHMRPRSRRSQSIIALVAAVLLLTGALNLRSAFGQDDVDWEIDPTARS